MEKILLTPEGKTRLDAELELLKHTERPAIVKAIAEARAHGDLSENAEYHSAKEKQGFIEARIRELEGVLSHAEVFVPDPATAGNRALFGCEINIEDEDGNQSKYRLVSQYEASAQAGMLSTASPLGSALIGKNVGDVIQVATPKGMAEYEIVAVSFPS